MSTSKPLTERRRVLQVLQRQPTDLLPWLVDLETWYTARRRTNTLPRPLADLELNEIHRLLAAGRLAAAPVTRFRLHGVEVHITHNEQTIFRDSEPALPFPLPITLLPSDRPGQSIITYKTPAGRAEIVCQMDEAQARAAAGPTLLRRILEYDEDLPVVKWILNHAEAVPDFERFRQSEEAVGENGFTIPLLGRIPFQQLLLDYMPPARAAQAARDEERAFLYLLDALREHSRHIVELALDLPDAPLLAFDDHLDGALTKPALFQRYCMPFLQEISARLHLAGRRLGSVMNGNLKPLLPLIPQAGVDVVLSFMPAPSSPLPFAEAWHAWHEELIIWGGIPPALLEAGFPEDDFYTWMEDMLTCIEREGGFIILGVGGQISGSADIQRLARISERLGRRPEL